MRRLLSPGILAETPSKLRILKRFQSWVCSVLLLPLVTLSICYGKSDRDLVVVVGAVSSGSLFPPAIRQYYRDNGLRDPLLVHVPDQWPIAPDFIKSFRSSDFDICLETSDRTQLVIEIDKILERTKTDLVAISGPFEGSIELADFLSESFSGRYPIATNGTRLSEARRRKDLMMEAVHPLRTPLRFSTRDASAAQAWVEEHNLLNQPANTVVVKPVKSGGSVGLHYVHSLEQVARATNDILGESNLYETSSKNQAVEIQEFLVGDEYVVNVVSSKVGDKVYRVVTDVWRYKKRKSPTGNDIYFFDELIPPEQIPPGLTSYVYSVMDKLEIHTGWGHAEVKMVADDPVLIEIGARPMGAKQPAFVEQRLGYSQTNLGVLAFLDPGKFRAYAEAHPIYEFPSEKRMVVYTLKAPKKGLWFREDSEQIIRSLPSVVNYRPYFSLTEPLPVTKDLTTAPGDIWLFGTPEQVESDINRLSELEENQGLYRKRPVCSLILRGKATLGKVASALKELSETGSAMHPPYRRYQTNPRW